MSNLPVPNEPGIEVRTISWLPGHCFDNLGRYWTRWKGSRGKYILTDTWRNSIISPGLARRPKRLIPILQGDGSVVVKYLEISRLVCEAFHGTPLPGQKALHWSDDWNDNRPSQLRWGSTRENAIDAIRNGGNKVGSGCKWAKLSDLAVLEIRALLRTGCFWARELAGPYGVSAGHICALSKGKKWRHIPMAERKYKRWGGEMHHSSKLTKPDVINIWKMIEGGKSDLKIAREYSVDSSSIRKIRQGRSWKHLTPASRATEAESQ